MMARAPPIRVFCTNVFHILILLSVFLLSSIPALADDILSHARTSGAVRRPMLLPLFLSSQSSSGTFSKSRRHLQKSDSGSRADARMRLYDDLLDGYYTTRLWIGTPPQMFALIVDSGSTVTYVPCYDCEHCGRHQDPEFQPELSSTYQPVKCNIYCNCDEIKQQCVYERKYAELSTSKGVLGEDIVSFSNDSDLAPQRSIFGCATVETGDLYSQRADGIMGLGRGDLSVVDQLVDKGVISDSFALCFGGMEFGGGAMILGGFHHPSEMVFTNSDPDRSPFYNIDLKEIHVAGKPLPLEPSVFDGKHGTVLDSGTTYAYLPEAAFVAFKDAITKELSSLQQIDGPDPNYKDTCFSGATSYVSELSKTFPAVEMVFSSGQKLLLSPENYLFPHSKVRGAYCLGVFQNGNDPTTLLGGIIVRNTLVVYDREHSKIGFWKTNCSELWERLHINGPSAPVGSPSSINSSNIEDGEIKIGRITFDISLGINSSNLEPQLETLFEIIAKKLDLDVSQVHLLSLTSEGNNSLIRWAILPPGSTSYFSNIAAKNMVTRLDEHHMQLPDTFGKYQLIKYELMAPANRTLGHLNYTSCLTSITSLVIVGLLATGVWVIWKRRQTPNRYKPVNESVPEQELQPL